MTNNPPPRGRPKTLDRETVVNAALMQYWDRGPAEVSINDICKLTGVSKPGVYREFGSDDGLKEAALSAYQLVAIDPFLELLDPAQTISEVLKSLIDFITQDREALGIPSGCLFVTMRAQYNYLGEGTQQTLDQMRARFLSAFTTWINAAKAAGGFRQSIPTAIAAHQFDALHAGAMRMQREKVPADEIREFLKFGFAGITGDGQILEHN